MVGGRIVKFWRIESSSRLLSIWNLAGAGYLTLVVLFILAIMTVPSIRDLAGRPERPGQPVPASQGAVSGVETGTAAPDAAQPAVAGDESPGAVADTGSAAGRASPQYDRPEAAGTSFIPLNFSLPQAGQAEAAIASAPDGSIKVRKIVQAGTNEVGAIDITIDRNSLLLIDVGDARRIFSGNEPALRKLDTLPASGMVSFKAMRDRGIDFRYDPNRDLITVNVR